MSADALTPDLKDALTQVQKLQRENQRFRVLLESVSHAFVPNEHSKDVGDWRCACGGWWWYRDAGRAPNEEVARKDWMDHCREFDGVADAPPAKPPHEPDRI